MFLFRKKLSNVTTNETEMDTLSFQMYINELSKIATDYEDALKGHEFTAPEVSIRIAHNGLDTYGSKRSVEKALTATNRRIETLNKMIEGKIIAKDDHQLLMEMKVFAQDSKIEHYKKVADVESVSLNRPSRRN